MNMLGQNGRTHSTCTCTPCSTTVNTVVLYTVNNYSSLTVTRSCEKVIALASHKKVRAVAAGPRCSYSGRVLQDQKARSTMDFIKDLTIDNLRNAAEDA